MNKFYGGGSTPCPEFIGVSRPTASSYQGPSREGVSGERQSPDPRNWHPYTREELAFAEAYQREQMQDGLTPEAG